MTGIAIDPAGGNGLRAPPQVAVDRPQTIRREKVGAVIGRADAATMIGVGWPLAVFLGLA